MKKIVVLASLLTAALTVSAIPVAPGGWINPIDEPAPVGPVIHQIVSPFSGSFVDGEVISTVLGPDALNPFGLTFTYEIIVRQANQHPLGQLNVGGYGYFSTDMSFSSDPAPPSWIPGGVAPVYADRGITGDVLSFDFSVMGGPGIWGGQDSMLLVVRTDSLQYNPAIGSVINSGSAEVDILSPIPEPASLALISLVTGGIYFTRRFFMA